MALGTVIRSFASPVGCLGLMWDGHSLWACEQSARLFYQLDINGVVQRSHGAPGGARMWDMCWDGTYIISSDRDTGRAVWSRPGETQEVYGTGIGVITGLVWDGRTLWVSEDNVNAIRQYAPDGTLLRSFASPDTTPYGLTWDGTHLWHGDLGTADRIYKIDPVTGTIITSFAAPATVPRGLTWDGRTLWLIDNGTGLIYQIMVN